MPELDDGPVLSRIREIVAGIDGIKAAYSVAESAGGLPEALNLLPCAFVLPGDDIEYILSAARQEYRYRVRVQVFAAAGATAYRGYAAFPFRARVIAALIGNVTLGGRVTQCLFVAGRFVALDYAGTPYLGWELTIEIIQHAPAATAPGN